MCLAQWNRKNWVIYHYNLPGSVKEIGFTIKWLAFKYHCYQILSSTFLDRVRSGAKKTKPGKIKMLHRRKVIHKSKVIIQHLYGLWIVNRKWCERAPNLHLAMEKQHKIALSACVGEARGWQHCKWASEVKNKGVHQHNALSPIHLAAWGSSRGIIIEKGKPGSPIFYFFLTNCTRPDNRIGVYILFGKEATNKVATIGAPVTSAVDAAASE